MRVVDQSASISACAAALRSTRTLDAMAKHSVDATTMRVYLESLPEKEVAAIYDNIPRKLKRRWEFWLCEFVLVAWCAAWAIAAIAGAKAILGTSDGGTIAGIAGSIIAVWTAMRFLVPPYIRWLNNRIVRDEVAIRLYGDGV